jgi:hypothetical protein
MCAEKTIQSWWLTHRRTVRRTVQTSWLQQTYSDAVDGMPINIKRVAEVKVILQADEAQALK